MGVKFERLGKNLGNLNKIKISNPGQAFGQDANLTIENASFSGTSLNVNSVSSSPQSITFNNDGTRMYITGFDIEKVLQYNLNTPFDLSTASLTNKSFNVSSQFNSPEEIVFNNTGTRMYMIGAGNNFVYQYNLTTGFDVSTASFVGDSFNVSSEDGNTRGLALSTDGTRMFLLGNQTDTAYQYNLSTPFDVTTASFSTNSFFMGSEDGFLNGFAFNSTGTRMFVVGTNNSTIFQYSLSTGFDLSTASFSNTSLNVFNQDDFIQGVTFDNTGTRMFVIGRGNNAIYQYDL